MGSLCNLVLGRIRLVLPLSLYAAADDRDVRDAGGEPREPWSCITEHDSSLGHRTIACSTIWSSDGKRKVKIFKFFLFPCEICLTFPLLKRQP